MWMLIIGFIAALVAVIAAGWGLWKAVKNAFYCYYSITADGEVTDSEKIKFAEFVFGAIHEAKDLWSFLLNLARAFRAFRR